MKTNDRINCLHCIHFSVSWDARFPRRCKLYGFKTAGFPSVSVLQSTGSPCLGFKPKDAPKSTD